MRADNPRPRSAASLRPQARVSDDKCLHRPGRGDCFHPGITASQIYPKIQSTKNARMLGRKNTHILYAYIEVKKMYGLGMG